ncbi:MAG TPA: phosphoglycerate mutase family protein, partial [Longimicrobiales bacterium]|nr:phosphoglycerate mutase family protein [Longimicrobiales bacterium]
MKNHRGYVLALAMLAVLPAGLVPVDAHAQNASRTTTPEAVEGRGESTAVLYLVRHAETADDGTGDPPLSEAGEARASRLARMLAGAGLTAIHTTPYQRTRGTAAAVAEALGLTAGEYDPADLPGFAARLAESGGRHLVVGHSNTTPALVAALGGDPGGPISESEYGRVYQLTLGDEGVHTVILGYPGGFLADPPPSPGAPAATARDVEGIEGLLDALYDVISGPAGEPRNWDRLRGLFLPTARMIPVQQAPDGRVAHRAMTVEEYIRSSGPMIEEVGFREHEVARRVERFGSVAHVFSTYEAFREGQDEVFMEGINSIQLIHDG